MLFLWISWFLHSKIGGGTVDLLSCVPSFRRLSSRHYALYEQNKCRHDELGLNQAGQSLIFVQKQE
jgi:hypothetical protein